MASYVGKTSVTSGFEKFDIAKPAGVATSDLLLLVVNWPKTGMCKKLDDPNGVLTSLPTTCVKYGLRGLGWNVLYDRPRWQIFWRYVGSSDPANYELIPQSGTTYDGAFGAGSAGPPDNSDTIIIAELLAWTGVKHGVKETASPFTFNDLDSAASSAISPTVVAGANVIEITMGFADWPEADGAAFLTLTSTLDAGMTSRTSPALEETLRDSVEHDIDPNEKRYYASLLKVGDKIEATAGTYTYTGTVGPAPNSRHLILVLDPYVSGIQFDPSPPAEPTDPYPEIIDTSSGYIDTTQPAASTPPPPSINYTYTTDTAPSSGSPSEAGSGYIAWEKDIDNPLIVEVWADVAGTLADLGDEVVCIGGQFSFNGLGACVGGKAQFVTEAIESPFSRVIRLKIDEPSLTSPDYWFVGVASNIRQSGKLNLWEVDLLPVLDLVIDDKIGSGNLYPSHSGVFTAKKNYYSGDDVDLSVGSTDFFQPWRQYLRKKFDAHPEASYGVAADLVYVQGRPQDAGFVTLDYSTNTHRIEAKQGAYPIPNYVTGWYAKPDNTVLSGQRSSIPLLVPRRVVQTNTDNNSELTEPVGSAAPYFSDKAYILKIAGLIKPPIKITNLPNGETQYAAGSQITIEPAKEGSGARIISTVQTVALPYQSIKQTREGREGFWS